MQFGQPITFTTAVVAPSLVAGSPLVVVNNPPGGNTNPVFNLGTVLNGSTLVLVLDTVGGNVPSAVVSIDGTWTRIGPFTSGSGNMTIFYIQNVAGGSNYAANVTCSLNEMVGVFYQVQNSGTIKLGPSGGPSATNPGGVSAISIPANNMAITGCCAGETAQPPTGVVTDPSGWTSTDQLWTPNVGTAFNAALFAAYTMPSANEVVSCLWSSSGNLFTGGPLPGWIAAAILLPHA